MHILIDQAKELGEVVRPRLCGFTGWKQAVRERDKRMFGWTEKQEKSLGISLKSGGAPAL